MRVMVLLLAVMLLLVAVRHAPDSLWPLRPLDALWPLWPLDALRPLAADGLMWFVSVVPVAMAPVRLRRARASERPGDEAAAHRCGRSPAHKVAPSERVAAVAAFEHGSVLLAVVVVHQCGRISWLREQ
jgi:hypothetical protein